MALADTAKLVASLELDSSKFTRGVKNAGTSLSGLSKAVAKSRAVAVGLGVGLERAAEKGISVLGDAIGKGIEGAQELERVQQQTQAVIQATGGAAGVSAQQVRDYANALEDTTTVDDKNVQAGEDVLLRYTQIGSKVFPKAAKAATDLAVALAKGNPELADTAAAAKIIGKALADPVKGITALRKAGIVLSKSQEDLIKNLSKAGKTEEAQGVILQELEKRYGKAGEAAAQGFGGDIRRAQDAIEDAEIAIAQGLMPAVGEVARELTTVLKDPQVISGLKELGKGIGEAIKGLVAFAKTVPWGSIASSLQAAAGFAKDLLNAFLGLPDWVKTAVITGWGLNKLTGGALNDLIGSLASGLIKGVLGINAGVVNVNGGVVKGPGGLPLPTGGAGGAAGAAASSAGGLGLTGLAVALTPATIAAVGLAVDAAVDPNDSLKAIGIAETAMARGIANWNNNGIAKLQEIANNTGDQAAIDWLRTHGVSLAPSATTDLKNAFASGFISGSAEQRPAKSQDIEDLRARIGDGLASAEDAISQADKTIAAKGDRTVNQVRDSGSLNYAATTTGAARIVGAINSLPVPIVNVDVQVTGATVERSTSVTSRGGAQSSDRYANGDLGSYGHPGR